jgi:hypothetical protein
MTFDPLARKVILEPTQYNDWRWAGSGVNPPGAPNAATLSEIATNQWCWRFTNNAVMTFPDQQIPHDYKEGTDLIPHIHWAPTTTATYTGTWTLILTEWLSAASGSARQAQVTHTAAFSAALTADQMQSQDFATLMSGLNRKISCMLTAYLSLSLSAGTACYLLGLDAHYQVDTAGSATPTSKT